jgi:hypothetical protein
MQSSDVTAPAHGPNADTPFSRSTVSSHTRHVIYPTLKKARMKKFSMKQTCTVAALLAASAAFSLAQPAFAQTSQPSQTIQNVYITWYGFNDNSCTVESQHNCNTIAYPKSDKYPVKHDVATEGKGTYADPITFATAANNRGGAAEFAPGTIIYVPMVHKYFIMEDQCAECNADWKKNRYHVDLWMGPSFEQNASTLSACENKLTQNKGVIIANPASNLPVDTTPLYLNGKCTTQTYSAQ